MNGTSPYGLLPYLGDPYLPVAGTQPGRVTVQGMTPEQLNAYLAQHFAIPPTPAPAIGVQPIQAGAVPIPVPMPAQTVVPIPAATPTGAVVAMKPTEAIVARPYRTGPLGLWGKEAYVLPGSEKESLLQARRQLETGAALSGAAQLAQLGLAFVPTAQDIENRRRLKEIESERQALEAQLSRPMEGLTPAQREAMTQAMVGRGGTVATEERLRQESAAASTPMMPSAVEVTSAREAKMNALRQMAQDAGAQIESANIAESARKTQIAEAKLAGLGQEAQQRIAYKAGRQVEARGALGRTIAEGAGLAGTLGGAKAIQGISPEEWQNMDPATRQMFLKLMQSGSATDAANMALARAIVSSRA